MAEIQRRLLEESIPRAKKCLDQLSEGEIWSRPNANSNSVGNLVLHLCGNARQWIVSAMGGKEDVRERQREFEEKGPIPKEQLTMMLDDLAEDIKSILLQISPEELTQIYQVQGFTESGIGILVHVVEHFSYHVGQITYFVKAHKDMDMEYYAGMDLDVKS